MTTLHMNGLVSTRIDDVVFYDAFGGGFPFTQLIPGPRSHNPAPRDF
ncbi:MAG: hypothetical protein KatS3mg059_1750 [Thermomicrobiales bacterium]|nr:MAG: hypothetical protein KatS3mg059_1750 [Thermomicrobiales bacterium]